jgi:hypothetical protein
MPESIILDPTELTTRTEFNITPWIAEAGPDWGEAQIEAAMAEQQVGAVPVDYSIPNRQVTIPLSIRDVGGTAFATARSLIQAKVGLWQAQGGYLKRVLASGGTVFADVVNAQLNLSGGWLQAHVSTDIEASVTLECIPDFYEAEETLSDHTETSAAELIFTETTANGGDFPLGDRVRVVVDEDDGDNQRGLIWAFRGRHYSSASTAASRYEAEALEPLDTAVKAAKVGASGGTVVTHGTILNDWTSVVGGRIGGTAWMTHTGTNKVYARVFSTSGTAVEARLVWDVADLVNVVTNPPATLYDGGTFHIVDLGETRLDPPQTGTHRWGWEIQGRGAVGGEALSIDKVWIVNADESAGVLQAPASQNVTSQTVVAWDSFATHAAGTLIGKTAPLGGNWTEAGDTDDFLTNGSGLAYRTAVSDANINTGQYARLGAGTATYTSVQADVWLPFDPGSNSQQGVFARYTDVSNWVMAAYTTSGAAWAVQVRKRVAGSVTTVAQTEIGASALTWRTLRMVLGTDGSITVYEGADGSTPSAIISTSDSSLATGAALQGGGFGLYDAMPDSIAGTRFYDDFYVRTSTTAADAVMYASQSAELSTQGIIREDTGGSAYGPVSVVNGDLPRFPNLSSGGTVEVFLKASRGDLEVSSDPSIDDISARVFRRASWLTTPG